MTPIGVLTSVRHVLPRGEPRFSGWVFSHVPAGATVVCRGWMLDAAEYPPHPNAPPGA
jgi:hypothetical protein